MLWTCHQPYQWAALTTWVLFAWSFKSYLCSFSPIRCVHISFRANRITSYHLNEQAIPKLNSYCGLGVIISDDLSWRNHYMYILSKAYKTLSLIHRTFKSSHSLSIKTKLYMTLVHSILTYCLPVWRPYFLNNINSLERIQRCVTKYILNDYTNDYKSRLINLNLLPLMYTHEIADILFFIKSIRNSTSSFNINNYITFYTGSLRLAKVHKLQHSYGANNISRHSYFNGITWLWSALPVINLSYFTDTIKNNQGPTYLIISLPTLILPIVEHSTFYVHVLDVNLCPDLQTLMTYKL